MEKLGIPIEKKMSLEWFKSYLNLILGTFLLAVGYTFFMTPYKIIPGGIYGISIILHYQLGFPIGIAALCFNLPLSLWGVKVLGRSFGLKTFICFILVAVFADTLPLIFGVDPFNLHDEVLLAAIFGGVIMGAGVGLILKARASSGGTDVLSSIIHKLTYRPIGSIQMTIDSIIVMAGLIVFQDWKIPLYSWLVIFIMGRVIDGVLQGYSSEKTFFIVTDKIEEVRFFILHELKRGGTIVPVNGMFNRSEKEMIITVVSRRQIVILHSTVAKLDPNAFIIVLDANKTIGKGFKKFE